MLDQIGIDRCPPYLAATQAAEPQAAPPPGISQMTQAPPIIPAPPMPVPAVPMPASPAPPAPRHAVPDLQGEDYLVFIARMQTLLQPRTYLEIGTRTGESLALARCPSIAIDPVFAVSAEALRGKRVCQFFQMSSDDFFRDYDPSVLLRGPIDLAFLDGMHLFEFLLRDFANVERHCRANSVIMMHDCIPTDAYVAERRDDPERRRALGSRPGWWTGDVWKIVPILKRHRPDLVIHAIDAAPTGLIMVTNLDPQSDLLRRNHFHIAQEFAGMELIDYGIARYIDELTLVPSGSLRTLPDIGTRFWL
jgi:hypothetical protein